MFEILLSILIGFVAGFLGSILGIGGGTLMVPLMVLAGIDVKKAVPASLVAVLGTSLGGLRFLFAKGFVKITIALILETASILGAITGVIVFGRLTSWELILMLGLTLIAIGLLFIIHYLAGETTAVKHDFKKLSASLVASYVAGIVSATLGIGGGVVKVPVLTLLLGLPIKVSIATSKFMVGITALVSVVGHGVLGRIDWLLALSLLSGTYIGSSISARLLPSIKSSIIYAMAVTYYFSIGLYMVLKALVHLAA